MSINDFEYSDLSDVDDLIVSVEGNIVNNYLGAKNSLDATISDALNASYDFGYLMGIKDERKAGIEALRLSGMHEAADYLEKHSE
jgi:hypothetical protein